jgi:hypothetical protein
VSLLDLTFAPVLHLTLTEIQVSSPYEEASTALRHLEVPVESHLR